MQSDQINPFSVQTPEDIPATDVVSLFVDVFGDFYNIPHQGHTFLNGPRGSGKSMMFRYLESDCQRLVRNCSLNDLPFFAVYVPIKNTEIKLTELKRLASKHAEVVLSEHFLVVYVAVKFFGALLKAGIEDEDGNRAKKLVDYFNGKFAERLKWNGWNEDLPSIEEGSSVTVIVTTMSELFSHFYSIVMAYLRRLAFTSEPQAYMGPLLGYLDFMLPVIKDVRDLGLIPNAPVFLLIDDADNLNLTQTRILNGWVSTRTSENVSIKISTQLSYKTYLTATSQTIASPHDFNEINISAVYTSARNKYLSRVEQIVKRRLEKYGIEVAPRDFFPEYEKQEAAIKEIGQQIRDNWAAEGRGFRASDDVTRYSRPDYIRSLQGPSKSGSSYRYAGFEQLVHISSGIIRYFLESASSMYGEMRAQSDGGVVAAITPSIQDRIVREQARQFFFGEFDKLELDEAEAEGRLDRIKKLRNLVQALGGMFHTILVSDAAERRVFSVALTDEYDKEVVSVLKLGVKYGYFHEAAIGNKEGSGRTRLFILSRRLAPLYLLDPTSFAGYKFVTSAALRNAMERPRSFVRQLETENIDEMLASPQQSLFDRLEN